MVSGIIASFSVTNLYLQEGACLPPLLCRMNLVHSLSRLRSFSFPECRHNQFFNKNKGEFLEKMRKIEFRLRHGNKKCFIEVQNEISQISKAIQQLDKDNRINKWFTTINRLPDESVGDWFKIMDEIY